MKKKITIVLLIVLILTAGGYFGYNHYKSMPTETGEKMDNVLEIVGVPLFDNLLLDLKNGNFEQAQKQVDLHIPAGVSQEVREYFTKLYNKVEVLDKTKDGEAWIYKIKYPISSDLSANMSLDDAIKVLDNNDPKLRYETVNAKVQVINDKLILNRELYMMLTLLSDK